MCNFDLISGPILSLCDVYYSNWLQPKTHHVCTWSISDKNYTEQFKEKYPIQLGLAACTYIMCNVLSSDLFSYHPMYAGWIM